MKTAKQNNAELTGNIEEYPPYLFNEKAFNEFKEAKKNYDAKNKMNKQDIFPLYVGKMVFNNKTKTKGNFYKYQISQVAKSDKDGEYSHHEEITEIDFACHETGDYFEDVNITDCQLILKRISDMSYENWVELSGYVFDLKLVNETAITMRDLLCNGDGAVLSLKSMTKIMFWLIQNGYALDDEWFTNGIAVEVEK